MAALRHVIHLQFTLRGRIGLWVFRLLILLGADIDDSALEKFVMKNLRIRNIRRG